MSRLVADCDSEVRTKNVLKTKNVLFFFKKILVESLGEKLKQARIQKNLSQDALAELAAVNIKQIQRYEKDELPKHSTGTLEKLDKVLNTHLTELFYDNKGRKKESMSKKPTTDNSTEQDYKQKYLDLLEELRKESKTNSDEILRIAEDNNVLLRALCGKLIPELQGAKSRKIHIANEGERNEQGNDPYGHS